MICVACAFSSFHGPALILSIWSWKRGVNEHAAAPKGSCLYCEDVRPIEERAEGVAHSVTLQVTRYTETQDTLFLIIKDLTVYLKYWKFYVIKRFFLFLF